MWHLHHGQNVIGENPDVWDICNIEHMLLDISLTYDIFVLKDITHDSQKRLTERVCIAGQMLHSIASKY